MLLGPIVWILTVVICYLFIDITGGSRLPFQSTARLLMRSSRLRYG